MVWLMLILGTIAAVIVLLISICGIYWWLSSGFDRYAPPVPASGKMKSAMLEDISEYLKSAEKTVNLLDLGSGWGTLLIPLAKRFPQHKFTGVERAMTPLWVSRFKGRRLSNIEFLRGDFFNYNLGDTDVVMFFLIGFMMPSVTKKCLHELKKGVVVYAYRFPLTGIEADRVVDLGSEMDTYYVYVMK